MAKNVAELCEEHAMTIEELAEETGLDQQRVLAIAMGRWTPAPKERASIATAFALTIDDIVWGHKTPIQHIYGSGPG